MIDGCTYQPMTRTYGSQHSHFDVGIAEEVMNGTICGYLSIGDLAVMSFWEEMA